MGRSGTRDSAKKLEALTNVDGVRRKEDQAFISFFFPFSFLLSPNAQTAVSRVQAAEALEQARPDGKAVRR